MSGGVSTRRDVPQWPCTEAVLAADGSCALTIKARTRTIVGEDLADTRTRVLEHVSAHAREDLGRAVRLRTTDPDGTVSELAVHPDGRVDELARDVASRAAGEGGGVAHAAPGRRRAPAGRGRRRGARGTVALVLAAVGGVAVGVALFVALRPDTSTPRVAHATTPATARVAAARLDVPSSRNASPTASADRMAAGARATARRRAARARRRAAARSAQRRKARAAARSATKARRRARRLTPPAAPRAPAVRPVPAPAPARAPLPAPATRPLHPRPTPGDLPPAATTH